MTHKKISRVPVIALFFICAFLMGIFISLLFLIHISYQPTNAAQEVVFDTSQLAPQSTVESGAATQSFELYADNGYLYKGQGEGLSTVVELLEKQPQVFDNNVQGAASDKKKIIRSAKKIIPAGFLRSSKLSRKLTDTKDNYLKKIGFNLDGEHYYFSQQINNLPVYKSRLAVHLKNKDEIYGLAGKLIFNETVPAATIEKGTAEQIALEKAKTELQSKNPVVVKSTEMILNKKLLGIAEDETNYPVLQVVVAAGKKLTSDSTMYFVALNTGEIIFTEPLTRRVLSRNVYDCTGPGSECVLQRTEGTAAVNDHDIDTMYDYLGQVYNYYKNTLQRDSYDNQGSELTGFVHLTDEIECPNAMWIKTPYHYFFVCDNMVGLDVIAHEYTHAVTEFTSELVSSYQSGALDEGISDVFAFALDTNDWQLGEDTALGVIRNGDDPTKDPPNRGGPHPDRLFSPYYYCGSQDNGGIHENMTILVKGFYLMVQGGSFNGCSISPIGRDKAHAIFYRAMTTYLGPTDNFRSAYNALTRACDDLYNPGSDTCVQVSKSLQAVEMDQQPAGTQTGASCDGIQRATPSCVNVTNPPPTATRIPSTNPTITSNPTGGPTITIINSPNPTTPTVTPVRSSPTPPRATVTLRPTATPLPQITPPAGSIVLNMKLRFQGILKMPTASNTMNVKVGIKQSDEVTPIFSTATFYADTNGIWSGTVFFTGKPAGDNYLVYVKGPKHIQKKICVTHPRETYDGTYHCGDEGTIGLQIGENNLDFSGIYQLAGDLAPQDGLVNSYDISLVRALIGDTTGMVTDADINLDGVIDTQDYSLIIQALLFKYDE